MVSISQVVVQNLSSINLPLKHLFLSYYFSCRDKLKKVQEIMFACIYCSCITSFLIFPLFLKTPEKKSVSPVFLEIWYGTRMKAEMNIM